MSNGNINIKGVFMPYKIKKFKGERGYYVVNSDTGEKKNKKPMPRSKALAYLKALYANVKDAKKKQ